MVVIAELPGGKIRQAQVEDYEKALALYEYHGSMKKAKRAFSMGLLSPFKDRRAQTQGGRA